jgi:hypothetical protein
MLQRIRHCFSVVTYHVVSLDTFLNTDQVCTQIFPKLALSGYEHIKKFDNSHCSIIVLKYLTIKVICDL